MEALRLADLEGMYFEQAASSMGVSRATFGRIAERARMKVAAAVVFGMPIAVSTGGSPYPPRETCGCSSCRKFADPCAYPGGSRRYPPDSSGRTVKIERKMTMRIACPVSSDEGIGSRIHEHFGSAPGFVIIDAVSMESTFVPNPNSEHGHGMCSPLAAFAGNPPDAVAAVGMGAGALGKLAASGIDVYIVTAPTAGEAVQMVVSGKAVKAGPGSACAGHGHHGGGCSDHS